MLHKEEFSQSIFISNWNATAAHLAKLRYATKLPQLNVDGICGGLCFCLIDYLQNGREDEFFLLYQSICTYNPKSLAFWINATTESVFINKLFELIYKIKVLQDKQLRSSFNESSNPRKAANYLRLGTNFHGSDKKILQGYKQIEHILEKLQPETANLFRLTYADRGHGVLAYKINSDITVFDPNVGCKDIFRRERDAAHYIMGHINKHLSGPWLEKHWDTVSKELFETTNFCARMSISSDYIELKYLSSPQQIVQPPLPLLSKPSQSSKPILTHEELSNALTDYKNNRYFGLAWLTTAKEVKEAASYLLAQESDETRYSLAQQYVVTNHNDLSQYLIRRIPQLKK